MSAGVVQGLKGMHGSRRKGRGQGVMKPTRLGPSRVCTGGDAADISLRKMSAGAVHIQQQRWVGCAMCSLLRVCECVRWSVEPGRWSQPIRARRLWVALP